MSAGIASANPRYERRRRGVGKAASAHNATPTYNAGTDQIASRSNVGTKPATASRSSEIGTVANTIARLDCAINPESTPATYTTQNSAGMPVPTGLTANGVNCAPTHERTAPAPSRA